MEDTYLRKCMGKSGRASGAGDRTQFYRGVSRDAIYEASNSVLLRSTATDSAADSQCPREWSESMLPTP